MVQTIYIDPNTGNLGIGTTAAKQALDIVGNTLISGNVGIGTTAARQNLDIVGNTLISGNVGIGTTITTEQIGFFVTGVNDYRGIRFYENGLSYGGFLKYHNGEDRLTLGVTNADVDINAINIMRGNGYVGIGTTNPLAPVHITGAIRGAVDLEASFYAPSCTASSYNYVLGGGNDISQKLVIFVNGSTRSTDGGANATVIRNDGGNLILGSTFYVTTTLSSSDYRRKKNIEPIQNALNDLVNDIQVIKFNYIQENDDVDKHIGFFAHEIQQYIPNAVVNNKDEVDENGNPVYQGIDLSKIVPFLASAIKELNTIVKNQQIQIDTLIQLNNLRTI